MIMGIVYVLHNKINGKYYVGQTIQSFKNRYYHHKSDKTLIGRAIRKYGSANFIHFENEVPESFMDNLERNLIHLYDCISSNGYNLDSGGNKGKHRCKATLIKMSDAQKGEKGSMFGRKHSEITKMKMSEAHRGRTFPNRIGPNRGKHFGESWRRKLSEAKRGDNNHWFGKHLPEEHRQKISQANSGNALRVGKPPWNKGKRLTKNPCRMTLWNWKNRSTK